MLLNFWKKQTPRTPSASERAQHSPVTLCVDCKHIAPIVSVEDERTGEGPRCMACTGRWMQESLAADQRAQAAD